MKLLLVSMIQGAMIVIFQCFFVFIHIGSQTWHSFPLHSIKFIDGWVTSLRRPFDYCKSRVVGKLLRQIHNNQQNSFFSVNQLVLFKFSFLYSPWEPEVWTHVFQQPSLLTVSPWIDDKLPWIFLRAFRLSVRLQAKTEGQPLLGKLRLICTTPTQLVHLIMTWLQNKTIQQCLTIF